MTSDDVTAWAAIAFGATISVAATALLIEQDRDPSQQPPAFSVRVVRVSPPVDIVDFAIIRSQANGEIMVRPEGPPTR